MSPDNDYLDKTAPIRAGEELDQAKLEVYLRKQLADLDGLEGSFGVEQFPGGHSNLTYLIRMGDREFVLRRPPFGTKVKSAHDMGREHSILSKLYKVYKPAPRSYHYCDDTSVIGAPFAVSQRIKGIILRGAVPKELDLNPEKMSEICKNFIHNLADLHMVDYKSVGLEGLGKPEGYAERQVRGWIKRWGDALTDDVPKAEALTDWLGRRIPAETGAGLVHNDYKFDNIMMDGKDLTKIVGVLDWEMATLGDPLMDLGGTMSYWIEANDGNDIRAARGGVSALPGCLTRQQLVDLYGKRTGWDVSNLSYFYCFGIFRIAVIIQQIYFRFVKGLTKDKRFAMMGYQVKVLIESAERAMKNDSL